MASACSTWMAPAASAVRVRSWSSRPWASRIARCAWARVVRVAWACQFAVEVAPGGGGDLGAVGVGQEPGLEGGQLGLGGLDVVEGCGGLGGVHGPDRGLGHGVELIAGTSQRPGDRVWLVRDRCHGT